VNGVESALFASSPLLAEAGYNLLIVFQYYDGLWVHADLDICGPSPLLNTIKQTHN
jgi:hypothetical protein